MAQMKLSFNPKPRRKARKIGQPSQRGHRDARTGQFTKRATPRLQKRRSKDTVPGYYPNPRLMSGDLLNAADMVFAALKAAGKISTARIYRALEKWAKASKFY